ncbi:GH43 family beta-xylosidase [Peribacillus deserti]|uniref:GH43 family beta-xylosidase n=1 Tax=Peribacillus deserti TaxID=673318 RepID=A0ABS2QKI2_9BACI|nr:family 43 glycosylhydrolase [Peribacillus deserti]MBM7693658.1 GH43 family beta-xylosidase [Peribacillus deserti]
MNVHSFGKISAAALLLPLLFTNMPKESMASERLIPGGPHTFNAKIDTNDFGVFKNPVIGDGADPWAVKHSDGYYYYTQTTGGNITIWKTKKLSELDRAEKTVVWTPSADAPNREHMWAPELHFINGKWYIYYAGSEGDMGKQRMYVLESEGADPLGPYHHPGGNYGKIAAATDKWAIDGTVLRHNDQLYFVWSGWEGDENVSQNLYIAPMKNPWTLSGDRVEISRPELEWEKHGTPLINEGPQILKNKKGQVFIVYSASGSWTVDYCLGMLSLDGKNPLKKDSWKKSQQPVFQKNLELNVYGPGHNSFVKSPDGKEDWIIYHAAKFQGAGWNRSVRMQPFTWNKDGTPNFGVPLAADTLMRVPSGESKGDLVPKLPGLVYKYEAEQGTVHNARIVNNTGASGGAKVGMIDFEDSYVEFNVGVPKGEYTLKVRYSTGMGETTSHLVSINGKVQELSYQPFGWDSWRAAEMDAVLDKEQNIIRISKGKLFTEIDSIELIPKEMKTVKYEAEHGYVKNAEVINDLQSSNHQTVQTNKGSKIHFPVMVSKEGSYLLTIKNESANSSPDVQKVYVNGRYTGLAMSSASLRLRKGVNDITLTHSSGDAEIDYISLSSAE